MSRLNLQQYFPLIEAISPVSIRGQVTNVSGMLIEGICPGSSVGAIYRIHSLDGTRSFLAEVVGFRGEKALLMSYGELQGVGLGSVIEFHRHSATIRIDENLLGRVITPLGEPLDDLGPIEAEKEFSIYTNPLNPMHRTRIKEPLDIGVKAINGLLTVGKGQRIGILSGSGVGKSVLLGMMAKNTKADINVIAMIGERGREVREFIERDLGKDGLARSIVIVATSDLSPVLRMRCAFVAATIAEYFRKQDANVLLMMDSVTRFSMAQREIGLSAGEPPTTKGYPPSVFSTLPKLFERAGNSSSKGSITGIYTVLIEADDINDPIGDTVRSIVDGHVVLSRKLAAKNHFPAIDVSVSASRVMGEVTTPEHLECASKIRSIMAYYAEAEDLINIGAYAKGSNPQIDEAISYIEPVRAFLRQSIGDKIDLKQCVDMMKAIFVQQNQQAAGGKARR